MRMITGRAKFDNSYEKYSRFEMKIEKKLQKGEISKKESAILLTNKFREVYKDLDYLPSNIIDFDRLYRSNSDESYNLNVILSFEQIDSSFLPILEDIEEYLVDKLQEENGRIHYVYELSQIDLQCSPEDAPLTIMNRTPLNGFFIMSGGISIKKPFDLIDHAICYILNDGYCVISARTFGLMSFKKSIPIYYPELKIALRSKLERNMVSILNEYNIKWEYEKKSYNIEPSKENEAFRLLNMYTPDFEIGNNTFIEVKGDWDKQSLYKCSAFIKQYPNYKLITFDELDMYHLDQVLLLKSGWTKRSRNTNKYNIKIDKKNLSDSLDRITEKTKIKIIEQLDNRNSKFVVTSFDDRLIGKIEEIWYFLLKQQVERGMVFEGHIRKVDTEYIEIQIFNTTEIQNIDYSIKGKNS